MKNTDTMLCRRGKLASADEVERGHRGIIMECGPGDWPRRGTPKYERARKTIDEFFKKYCKEMPR